MASTVTAVDNSPRPIHEEGVMAMDFIITNTAGSAGGSYNFNTHFKRVDRVEGGLLDYSISGTTVTYSTDANARVAIRVVGS